MKSILEFIQRVESMISLERDHVKKFAENLKMSKDPGYELNWSINVFKSAAKIQVFTELLRAARMAENLSDEDIDEVFPPLPGESREARFKRYIQSQVPSRMSFSTSSSPTANIFQDKLNEVWREVALDYYNIWSS